MEIDQESRLKKEVLAHNIMGISEYEGSKKFSKDFGNSQEEEEILKKVELAREWWVQVKWWRMIKLGDASMKNLMYGMKIYLSKFLYWC